MQFGEIQMAVTALFLLTAVAVVVFCNHLRKRNHRRTKVVRGRYVSQRRPVQSDFEPAFQTTTFQTASPVSFWPELAVLADAGMREESSDWRKPEFPPNPNPALAPAKKLGVCEPSKSLQLPPLTVDEFLFDILVSGASAEDVKKKIAARANRTPLPSMEVRYEVLEEERAVKTPAGMIERRSLARLLEANKSFSGVVVSISINEDQSSRCSESSLEWVENYIAGLLEDQDFGCRTALKEFLLVCPTTLSAKAQRRLSEISERLWEFQLRGIGTHTIVFNWGGVEVQNRPLAEALTAATERMLQNRRGRNPIYVNSVNTRR